MGIKDAFKGIKYKKVKGRTWYALGLIAIAYFVLMQAINPVPLAFADVWLLLGAALIFLARAEIRLSRKAKVILGAALSCGAAFTIFCLAQILFPRTAAPPECRYVILLGGGVRHDGTLTALMKERVRVAAEFARRHPEAKVVATGGRLKFTAYAEAPVMARALREFGVEEERVIIEDKALDTIQNLRQSLALIAGDAGLPPEEARKIPIAIVTSRFHLARAERLARFQGFESVSGVAAGIPAVFVPNAYAREVCAYAKLLMRRVFLSETLV